MDGQGHRSIRGALFVSVAEPSCPGSSRHGSRTLASDRRYPLVAHHPTRTIDRWTNVRRQAASLDVFLSVFRPRVEILDLNSFDVPLPRHRRRSPSQPINHWEKIE